MYCSRASGNGINGGGAAANARRRRLDDRIIESLSSRLAAASSDEADNDADDGDDGIDDEERAAFDDVGNEASARRKARARGHDGGDGRDFEEMVMRVIDRLEQMFRRRR